MNAKCQPLSRSTVGGQLTAYEIVQMLNAGYRLDGQYSEAEIRRAAEEGDNTTRFTRLQVPNS